MCKSFLIISLLFSLVSFRTLKCDLPTNNCPTFHQSHVLTIPCDFQIIETDPFYPEKFLDRIDVNKIRNTSKTEPNVFECEERDDEFVKEEKL